MVIRLLILLVLALSVVRAQPLTLLGVGHDAPHSPVEEPIRVPVKDRLVIVISIDGLRPDAWEQADTPALDRLAAAGSFSRHARSSEIPKTLPSHASMITGVQPSVHGLDYNRTHLWEGPIEQPTVFRWVRAAGVHTTMVASKHKFYHFNVAGDVEAFRYTKEDLWDLKGTSAAVLERARGYLDGGRRGLYFLHLPEVDDRGHRSGWMSPEYMEAIELVDREIAGLVRYLEERDLLRVTTFLITADHGGSGFDHGPGIPHSATVPFIVSGLGARAGGDLGDEVSVLDIAPTAAALFGVPPPVGLGGRAAAAGLAFTPPAPSYRTNQLAPPDRSLWDRVGDTARRFWPPF